MERQFSKACSGKAVQMLGFKLKPTKHREGKQIPLLGLLFSSSAGGPQVSNLGRRCEPLAADLEELAEATPLFYKVKLKIIKNHVNLY